MVRIGIYRRKPVTGLCNKSAIRLCAVDLPETAEGAVKSKTGLRTYGELGGGPRGAREIFPSRSLFQQRTPGMGVFYYNGCKALISAQTLATGAHGS